MGKISDFTRTFTRKNMLISEKSPSQSNDEFITLPANQLRGGDKIKLDMDNEIYTVEKCHVNLQEKHIKFNLTDSLGLNVYTGMHVNQPVKVICKSKIIGYK